LDRWHLQTQETTRYCGVFTKLKAIQGKRYSGSEYSLAP
jgi:hypothetical protein